MGSKRSSIKGKGADIYLGDASAAKGVSRHQQSTDGPSHKATFYIPSSLLDQLDDAWLDLRRLDRSVKKSSLVAAAIEAALADYAAKREESFLYQSIIGANSPKDS